MNADQLTAKYIELRDRRTALKKQYEEKDGELKVMMEAIETRLRSILTEQGGESMRTPHGTVYRTWKEYANVADWEKVLEFIQKYDAWDMLERRISKTAVRDRMMPDNDGGYINPPPPGVNFTRIETVNIRRR